MDASTHPIDLPLRVLPQPDDATCGPTCLHAVYQFWGDEQDLGGVVERTGKLANGGTLAALLALDALDRGYRALIYTCDLHVFDPTWFDRTGDAHPGLAEKLQSRGVAVRDERTRVAIAAFCDYLARGGTVRMVDPTPRLIARHLERGEPVITGLCSTWLYRAMRVTGPADVDDDVIGDPQGHFVVLSGYDPRSRLVQVDDPAHPSPLGHPDQRYAIGIERLICAILLGIVTNDANLLVLLPEVRKVP